ncbi:hypothetical protein ACS0TY_003256 [Phlomoides rotata]
MIVGARDVGISPSIVGSFPKKEAALVELRQCLLMRSGMLLVHVLFCHPGLVKFKEKTYSRDQIDEMRMEWVECIQREI